MSENLTVKVLSQTSENIQRLFDLTTRIDERVKMIQTTQEETNNKIKEVVNDYNELLERMITIEVNGNRTVQGEMNRYYEQLSNIDKRINMLEHANTGSENRWNRIFSFVIQLIWVVLASWVLYKLQLNPPNLP